MGKILINNVFVGGYGYDIKNLPHEFINFYKTDSNEFYIYITPYGKINDAYINDIECVIFVRSFSSGIVEVLGKAEGIIDYYPRKVNLKKDGMIRADSTLDEEVLRVRNEITYGSKSLAQIDTVNTNGIGVSMKVKKTQLVRDTIFFVWDRNKYLGCDPNRFYLIDSHQINNTSMKAYYDSKSNDQSERDDYERLRQIINNEGLWKSETETPNYNTENIYDDNTFIKVLRKQDDEVAFSNLLYYYLSTYSDIRKKFIEKVLKINLDDYSGFVVEREKDKVDISLKRNDCFIIIENKIKSSINGLKYDDKKRIIIDEETGLIKSQLDKYYDLIFEECHDANKIHPYILLPNYSIINRNAYLKGNLYNEIRYLDIYNFFNEYKNIIPNDKYVEDYIKAMYKHSKNTDIEFINEIMIRLHHRIMN